MFNRIGMLTCGLGACIVSLALVAVPYPAIAQSVEDLRAEIEALRKENASLRERDRLAKENAALRKRPAPSPLCTSHRRTSGGDEGPVGGEPSLALKPAADLPVKARFRLLRCPGRIHFGGGVSREQRKPPRRRYGGFHQRRDTNTDLRTSIWSSSPAPVTSSAAGSGNIIG
jgi:hypothetical protein